MYVSMSACVWEHMYVQGYAHMCGGVKLMSTIALQFIDLDKSGFIEPEFTIS